VDSGSSYNLVGSDDGSLSGISDGVNGNQIGTPDSPIDPGLAPLDDHGGPTQTRPLLANSPALNAGDPGLSGTPDQRGVVRSGGVNIGAFQASVSSLVISPPTSVTAGAPFDVTVSAFDPFRQPAVGYTGTIHFTSGNPGATLPADYTFQLSDGGQATFPGVSLSVAGTWDLTATDAVNNLSGSAMIDVTPGSAVAFHLLVPPNVGRHPLRCDRPGRGQFW
jgi:hypothetical protein